MTAMRYEWRVFQHNPHYDAPGEETPIITTVSEARAFGRQAELDANRCGAIVVRIERREIGVWESVWESEPS